MIDLRAELENLKAGEQIIVNVGEDLMQAMQLLLNQQDALDLALRSVQENRYGYYDTDSLVEIAGRIQAKEKERRDLIDSVGVALLGETYREILDETGCEFQVDIEHPVVIFFKVGA